MDLNTALRATKALPTRFARLIGIRKRDDDRRAGNRHEAQQTVAVLEGEIGQGYALRSPIQIALWREGREVVADAPDLNLHAFGHDTDEARRNLGASLIEQFRRLEELGDKLGPGLMAERDRLRQLLVTP